MLPVMLAPVANSAPALFTRNGAASGLALPPYRPHVGWAPFIVTEEFPEPAVITLAALISRPVIAPAVICDAVMSPTYRDLIITFPPLTSKTVAAPAVVALAILNVSARKSTVVPLEVAARVNPATFPFASTFKPYIAFKVPAVVACAELTVLTDAFTPFTAASLLVL
ncbi:hypothetical protein D3C85_1264720 [compost metagenome]